MCNALVGRETGRQAGAHPTRRGGRSPHRPTVTCGQPSRSQLQAKKVTGIWASHA
jgi:hypothetical protein